LTIRDSYLLLPSSLNKLCKTFNTEIKKGIEPVLINDITYSSGSSFYISKNISHYSKDILKLENFLEWKHLIKNYCEAAAFGECIII
jgi:hypothetical protein